MKKRNLTAALVLGATSIILTGGTPLSASEVYTPSITVTKYVTDKTQQDGQQHLIAKEGVKFKVVKVFLRQTDNKPIDLKDDSTYKVIQDTSHPVDVTLITDANGQAKIEGAEQLPKGTYQVIEENETSKESHMYFSLPYKDEAGTVIDDVALYPKSGIDNSGNPGDDKNPEDKDPDGDKNADDNKKPDGDKAPDGNTDHNDNKKPDGDKDPDDNKKPDGNTDESGDTDSDGKPDENGNNNGNNDGEDEDKIINPYDENHRLPGTQGNFSQNGNNTSHRLPDTIGSLMQTSGELLEIPWVKMMVASLGVLFLLGGFFIFFKREKDEEEEEQSTTKK